MHRNQVSSLSTKLAPVLEAVAFNILGTLVLASELYNLIWPWWRFSWAHHNLSCFRDRHFNWPITSFQYYSFAILKKVGNARFLKPNQTLWTTEYVKKRIWTRVFWDTSQWTHPLVYAGFERNHRNRGRINNWGNGTAPNSNLTRPVLFTFQVEENLLLFGFSWANFSMEKPPMLPQCVRVTQVGLCLSTEPSV